MKKTINIVTGVIGEDVHITGIRILEHALRKSNFKVASLGIHNSDDDFINAAKETNADAIMISSLAGHARLLVGDLRNKCNEAGLKDVLLYLGGQLVVEEQEWSNTEKIFLDMGFNWVCPPYATPRTIIENLKQDFKITGS